MEDTPKSGIFAKYQPRYAEQNVITFPVGPDKKPAIKNWQKLGSKGSAQLAVKFSDSDSFGFALGPRSGVTILDVDTKDESVLHEAQSRWGVSPYVVATGGGYHAYYRYGGERRHIRPLGPDLPMMFLVVVMRLVRFPSPPRGNTKSSGALWMIFRNSPRFTSCLMNCGSQSRRVSAINHCFDWD
jgi:hypothetical protein